MIPLKIRFFLLLYEKYVIREKYLHKACQSWKRGKERCLLFTWNIITCIYIYDVSSYVLFIKQKKKKWRNKKDDKWPNTNFYTQWIKCYIYPFFPTQIFLLPFFHAFLYLLFFIFINILLRLLLHTWTRLHVCVFAGESVSLNSFYMKKTHIFGRPLILLNTS